MTDIEVLESQYEKYKDKTGRRARALKMRIESLVAINDIVKSFYEMDKSK